MKEKERRKKERKDKRMKYMMTGKDLK